MTLELVSPDQWWAFAESHPERTPFHHPAWQDLLQRHYGFAWRAPALIHRGEVVAAAPFLATRSLSGKRRLTCLPFSDCVRPLARSPAHLTEFWTALQAETWDPYDAVIVRTDGPVPSVPVSRSWVRHVADLQGADGPPAPRSSVRRNIRKAEKAGLRFASRTDPAAIESFYRLHLLTRRKLGVPVQTKGFFRGLHAHMIASGLGFVATVSRGAQVVSAAVFLGVGSSLVYKYGASDPAALPDRPNELLFSNAIDLARDEGYETFDFGVTRVTNEGLRRFKTKWGAMEHTVLHAYIRGLPPRSAGPGLGLRVAKAVIRHSPTFVCRALGAALYRYAP